MNQSGKFSIKILKLNQTYKPSFTCLCNDITACIVNSTWTKPWILPINYQALALILFKQTDIPAINFLNCDTSCRVLPMIA